MVKRNIYKTKPIQTIKIKTPENSVVEFKLMNMVTKSEDTRRNKHAKN